MKSEFKLVPRVRDEQAIASTLLIDGDNVGEVQQYTDGTISLWVRDRADSEHLAHAYGHGRSVEEALPGAARYAHEAVRVWSEQAEFCSELCRKLGLNIQQPTSNNQQNKETEHG